MVPLASALLTPFWKPERVRLVLGTEAVRLCRQHGFQAVPAHRALTWLDGLSHREMATLRDFVARARLSVPPLQGVGDSSLLALLRTWVRSGQVAVVREGSQGAEAKNPVDVRRRQVVRAVQAEAPRGLEYRGRRYRLVADRQLPRLADRDGYEVVSRQDAVEVLHALAAAGGHAALAQSLTEAAGLLTPDWRPPRVPDGLVLLRRIVVQEARRPDLGPTLTPSQLKKLAQNHWIEIELYSLDDEPCFLPYRLEVPGQSSKSGKAGDDGFVGVYDIDAGTGRLLIDGPAKLDDPVELAGKLVDELGQALAGVEVSFKAGGRTLPATTDGDGVAKVERRGLTTGTVRPADEKALRQLLYDRWGKVRGEAWLVPPAGEPCSIVEVRRAEQLPAIAVAAQQQRTVVLQPRVVRARLLGMWFDTSKCFLLPTARKTLPLLKDLYAGSPESDLLIVGHTDTAGQPSYNDPLQEIVQTLATGLGKGPKRIAGPWGEVNIVCHGNEVKMHPPITTGGASWIGSHDIKAAAAAVAKWPKLGKLLDGSSYVVIRGCNIGHNGDLLTALKETIFQDCCSVCAPLHYVHYEHVTETGKLALAWEPLWERLYHYHDGSDTSGADAVHESQFTTQHPTLAWATERASYDQKAYTYGAAAEALAPERGLYDDSGTDYVRFPDSKWKDPVAKETFTATPEEYMNQPPEKWAFGTVKVTATAKTLTDEVVLESTAVPGSPCCLIPGDARNAGAAQTASGIGWRLPGAADLHARIEWPAGGGALRVTPEAGQQVIIRPKGGKPLTVSGPDSGKFNVGDTVVFGTATVTIRRAKEHRIAFDAMSTKCEVRRRILRKDTPAQPYANRASIAPDIFDGGVTFQVV